MDTETKVVYHGVTVVDASKPQPPPYPNYPAPGPAPTAVIVQTAGSPLAVTVPRQVGPQPTPMVCGSCHAEIVSRVEKQSSTKTHLFALGLCLIGCWCCVCIPYCTDTCKNTNHYCPNCNAYIGAYKD